MKYKIFSRINTAEFNSGQMIGEFFDRLDAEDQVEYISSLHKVDVNDFYIDRVFDCQTCGQYEAEERHDAYGHSTGYHCDDCYYDSSKYKYRKDAYPIDSESRY